MLEQLMHDFIADPENPEKNYAFGREYEKMNQTASAFTFYLRAAERTDNKDLAYECLIRLGNCYNAQGNRKYSVKSMYKAAISLIPERPEAHYYLSLHYENDKHYFDSYTAADIALKISEGKVFTPIDLYYPGRWVLTFQKAVAAWWRGRGTESRALFQQLVDENWSEMDQVHRDSVERNINYLGCNPPSYIHRMYNPKMYGKMRYKFTGSSTIKENFSQVYQDLFVLSVLKGKTNGSFLEIGGAVPFKGNNTALLEKHFNWRGLSIEFDANFAKEYREARPGTKVVENDALKIDYVELLSENFVPGVPIDYLQLDIEPAQNTYECMLRIPFDKYKFRVITYEHDHYADMTRSYRSKSRKFLSSKGYVLVAGDISPDGVNTFEDWWVHPGLVDADVLKYMMNISNKATDATEYMFPKVSVVAPEFDWGLIEDNPWFRGVVESEVFIEDVYQKFVKVQEGDIVLDIGASVGPFAYKIKDAKPGKVVCVEPHKELWRTQLNNVGKWAVCINKAIGSVDGQEIQNGLFNENLVYSNEDSRRIVDTITFKTLLKETGIDRVDFMKIDCEGGEYAIFNDENYDWIMKNVDFIAGEWHLATKEQKENFRRFRDKYLTKFKYVRVYSADFVDIKHSLFSEWFLTYYETINVYIDNHVKDAVPRKLTHTLIDNRPTKNKKTIEDKWKYSIAPTLEFTTTVPEKGCIVDCVFCPQRTLVEMYKGERRLTLENFKRAVDKLPKEIRVTFSGFVEPWLNSECTDMVLYAHEKGHPISIFTTLVGMGVEDLKRIKHIPFAGNPNGGFTVHLPDQELNAKHPINKRYMETVIYFRSIMDEIQNLQLMTMGTVHESIKPLFEGIAVHSPEMWSRAGNLIGERILKPELENQHFLTVDHGNKVVTCGCDERLYHNIMLPNGDVSLCCMDYGLEEITGNLFEQDYNDVIPDPYTAFALCQKCENAIEVENPVIQNEKRRYGL
jgi:FkbM family methyltransferase